MTVIGVAAEIQAHSATLPSAQPLSSPFIFSSGLKSGCSLPQKNNLCLSL